MEKVNICGIPESEFEPDGWCQKCGSGCKMTEDVLVNKRIYDFAMRKGIVKGGKPGTFNTMFSKSEFAAFFADAEEYANAPQYVKRYLEQTKK